MASGVARRRPRAGRPAALPRQKPRQWQPTVSAVIPALNEADNIGWVIERLPDAVTEVVLVDGLSTDDTEAIARKLLANLVVVHQPRPGKGAALRAGFAAASGDIVVMLDADGSNDPAEMESLVQALGDGAEFVKGSRHLGHGGSDDWTRIRRGGNRGLVKLVNFIYGSHITDLCYGYCAFWRRHLDALALTADGFEIETQLVLNAVKSALAIRELPSYELARRTGNSKLHAFRDGRRVLNTIMDERPGGRSGRNQARTEVSLERIEMEDSAVVYSAVERPVAPRTLLAA